MNFKQPGPWLFALGMIGLGTAALQLLWMPDPAPAPGWWIVPPLCQIAAGTGLLFRRAGVVAAGVLALYWLAWLVFLHVPGLIARPGQFTLWVSAAQALTFASVAAAFVRSELWIAARAVLGATVVLFGGVHVLNPGIVAGLLPDWFPVPGVWPYLTGAFQIAAGTMILIGFRATLAAFLVGLMWLSWIPLVHAPRLLAAPDALLEWSFMLTAVALAGAAWSVGERIAAKSGEDFQPSVR